MSGIHWVTKGFKKFQFHIFTTNVESMFQDIPWSIRYYTLTYNVLIIFHIFTKNMSNIFISINCRYNLIIQCKSNNRQSMLYRFRIAIKALLAVSYTISLFLAKPSHTFNKLSSPFLQGENIKISLAYIYQFATN